MSKKEEKEKDAVAEPVEAPAGKDAPSTSSGSAKKAATVAEPVEAPAETYEEARQRRRRRRVRQQRLYTFIALIVIAALAAGIYFGGTYLYNRFSGEQPLRATPSGGTSTQSASGGDTYLTEEEELERKVDEIISQMSLSDKVSALFVVTPTQLTGIERVTASNGALSDALAQYPVGGLVFDTSNMTDKRQLQNLLSGAQRASIYPLFLAVEETGGDDGSAVASLIRAEAAEAPSLIGARIDAGAAETAGQTIGTYLTDTGFNLVLAPNASLLTGGSDDSVFGTEAQAVAQMTGSFIYGAHTSGIFVATTYFPVPGAEDRGGSATQTQRTMAELTEAEYLPFITAKETGTEIIMLSNISAPRATGDTGTIPCSISEAMITGQLRTTIGYEGIIMTDAFDQNVITEGYTSDHISVAAIVAGADLIYRPEDFHLAHEGVMDALQSGVITEERINQSLRRIYRIKLRYS